jgi:hypothetical protein
MSYIPLPDSVGEVLYSPTGHYTVGSSVFYSNRDAMVASNRTGQPVQWHYYDHIWQQAHDRGQWRNQNLDQLYRARARQIREQYDYVGVLFSGGWDSRNIIETFAKEGLHIDDIIIFVVPELEKSTSINNQTASNWYGEIMYHAVPFAEQFKQLHPTTNITQIEWLDIVEHSFKDPDQLLKDSRPKPGVLFGRWLSIAREPNLEKRIAGRRACLLNGTDKPCVIQNETMARGFFPEGLMRLNSYCTKSNGFPGNVIWEPFYWTPDLPELAIRGWYELLDLCRSDPIVNRAHSLNETLEVRTVLKSSRYVQDAMRRRLYQEFDATAWQADKQSDFGFFMEIELPILRVLEQTNPHIRAVLGEILNETAHMLGESQIKIGDRTNNGLIPWVDKTIHDGHTVLDYTSFLSKLVDLETNVN